jgi:murein DD-endopeptidase MepM/ murein hydrolase activator NlpD
MGSGRNQPGLALLRLALPLGLLLFGAAVEIRTRQLLVDTLSPLPVAPVGRFSLRAVRPNEPTLALAAVRAPLDSALGRGETLARLLTRLGVSPAEARSATNAAADELDLRLLRAGSPCRAYYGQDSALASIDLQIPLKGRLQVSRDDGGGWQANWQEFTHGSEVRALRGVLEGSLEASLRAAGGPAALAARMAEALRWDLDFGKDLRRGDHFAVLYEENQLDGAYSGIGGIIAVSYENRGRSFEAYRYGDQDSYYDREGRPLKAQFLRSPLRYSHVTSSFSESRFHPVLHDYRPHHGVDYSAPVGTPVLVTADGVVTFAGWDGGGGNVVKVRHPGNYESAYLHLSRFASGVRAGTRIRQGAVIAYTGATGLATGPHLDYRVKYHEQWVDPLALRTARNDPIAPSELAAFRAWQREISEGLTRGVVPAVARSQAPGSRALPTPQDATSVAAVAR